VRRTEGRLEFDFRTAYDVEQPEVRAQPFKCADFISHEVDETWMIEVTEAVKAPIQQFRIAVSDLLGQLKSGSLKKDMLMKLYGTHAYLVDINSEPNKRVFFCVVIGLPMDDAAQRIRIRDEMKRVTDRIGPSFYGTVNRPIIKVESIESWNASHPDVQIT
jgi:hypothetical protein